MTGCPFCAEGKPCREHRGTQPIPLFRSRAVRCAGCGKMVAWSGRDGFRELRAFDSTSHPTGLRGCDRGTRWRRWLPNGWLGEHDPSPAETAPPLAPIAVWGLGAAILLVLIGLACLYGLGRLRG